MAEILVTVGSKTALPKTGLENLVEKLGSMGYRVIGPQIQDDAIVYKPLKSAKDLPRGYISQQDNGSYRLAYTGHPRYFDATPGAQSLKQFFFPQQTELAKYTRDENGHWQIEEQNRDLTPLALFGVFPCDLAAIQVQPAGNATA